MPNCRRCSECAGLDHHWMEPTSREDEDGEPIMRPNDQTQRPPGYTVAVDGQFGECVGGGFSWGWTCGDEDEACFESEAEAVDGAWSHYLVVQECKHCPAVRSWDPDDDDLEAEDCEDVVESGPVDLLTLPLFKN